MFLVEKGIKGIAKKAFKYALNNPDAVKQVLGNPGVQATLVEGTKRVLGNPGVQAGLANIGLHTAQGTFVGKEVSKKVGEGLKSARETAVQLAHRVKSRKP